MSGQQITLYLALVLLVLAFAPKTALRARSVGIVAGAALMLHGALVLNGPLIVAGALIALINALRLVEMRRLVSAVRIAAEGPMTVDWLLPYMRPLEVPGGHVLFAKGDKAEALYFVSAGRVRLEEQAEDVTRGSIFGEIGIFTADQRRTVTARCVEPCSLLIVTAEKVRELYFQNPKFGFYLVGLAAQRLVDRARERKQPAGTIV